MRYLLAVLALTFVAGLALDASAQQRRWFETTDEARQRHSSERYQQYQQRGWRGAPLGGYNDRLGDTAPRGTERPGYSSPQPYGRGGSQYDDPYKPRY